jgi:hypothetical protein
MEDTEGQSAFFKHCDGNILALIDVSTGLRDQPGR